jgi:hypothetical protein
MASSLVLGEYNVNHEPSSTSIALAVNMSALGGNTVNTFLEDTNEVVLEPRTLFRLARAPLIPSLTLHLA